MNNKKLAILFSIIFLITGGFLMGAYIYTHTEKTGYVPPEIYVRFTDSLGNPVINATCYADIETEKGYVEDRLLQYRWIFRELNCFGRECNKEDFSGYYRLNIYNYSIKRILFSFFKMDGLIYGDFDIRVVCMTDRFIAYYEFNQTNFPCSLIPLEGNYLAPGVYCPSKEQKKEQHAYSLSPEEFDDYDTKAINFINENYKDKIVLANNKLSVVIYSQKVNKPVGIIPDKTEYGDPYIFMQFYLEDYCNKRMEIVERYNISLILSRFELDKCNFMKEIYSDKDYIYEIKE